MTSSAILDDHPALCRPFSLAALSEHALATGCLETLGLEAGWIAASAIAADWFVIVQPSSAGWRGRLCRPLLGEEQQCNVEWEGDVTQDSAGLAAQCLASSAPVESADLAATIESEKDGWRRVGVAAGALFPLRYAERLFGLWGVAFCRLRALDERERVLLQTCAHLISGAVARHRAERALSEQTKFLATAMDNLEAMVIVLESSGRIRQINRAAEQISEFSRSELKGRTFASAFLLPDEAPRFSFAADRARRGAEVEKCDTYLLTKRGERRRISWSISAVRAEGSSGKLLLATGVDVTERHHALKRLRELESEAERSRRDSAAVGANAALDQEGAARPAALEPYERRSPEIPEDDNRRGPDRRPYPYIQTIAPMADGTLPPLESFFEVRCHDISAKGFSYLVPEMPAYKRLVVAFGSPAAPLYLIAEIVHRTRFRHNGRDMVIAGCRFLGRAQYGDVKE